MIQRLVSPPKNSSNLLETNLWLLYSGCSVPDLVNAINSFYDSNSTNSGPSIAPAEQARQALALHPNEVPISDNSKDKKNVETNDLGLASKVWRWLVARNDVSVGPNRKYNHLPLDEVLRICQRERASSATTGTDIAPSQETPETPSKAGSSRPSKKRQKSDGIPEVTEPRLHVSEERQWKTLTGHGPDFKRIPLFEWKALIDIASVKERGILQGDLVRLTGQDKRSLPTRTDALAKKGYIIKQPILLRGFRSSKLWLKQYAESAQEEARREGLPLEELDLSKETLMKDLTPVTFSNFWNGDRLDYLAIAQGFIAIIKAWGIIRYCDLRTKMGVDERVPQMRALAKSSRWFTNIGSVTFVAARFANSSKLFKDCVKFVRDPTPSEWKKFRTIPTNHIKAPSSRIGKRGQASRDKAKSQAKSKARSKAKSKAGKIGNGGHDGQVQQLASKSPEALFDQMEVKSSSWMPQKPFINTVFDIIKRSGAQGSSNNEIRHQTLGYSYRKFIASMNASLSSPLAQLEQPEFQVTSQLTRVVKTMSYQFFAPGGAASQRDVDETRQDQDPAEITQPVFEKVDYTFSEPDPSKFTTAPSISLSQLCAPVRPTPKARTNGKLEGFRKEQRVTTGKVEVKRPRGRPPKKPRTTESLDVPEAAEPQDDSQLDHMTYGIQNGERRGPGRARRKPKTLDGMVLIPDDDDDLEDFAISSPIREGNASASIKRRAPSLPDAPGVYRGIPNSLDPVRKQGRPPKSLVVIFKSDRLKDPAFLGATTETSPNNGIAVENGISGIPGATDQAASTPLPVANGESTISAEADQSLATQGSAKPKRGQRSDSKKGHKCEQCGRTWKNSNGLEYHINKSQTPCNPLYVQQSPWRRSLPVPHTMPQLTRGNRIKATSPLSQTPPRVPNKATENGSTRELPRSKSAISEENSVVSVPDTPSILENYGRSIILQDVEVYNVTDRGQLQGRRRSESRHGEASTPQSPRLSHRHQNIKEHPRTEDPRVPQETIALSSDNAGPKQSVVSPQNHDISSARDGDHKLPHKRDAKSMVSTSSHGTDAELESPRKRQKLPQLPKRAPSQPNDGEQQQDRPEQQAKVSIQNPVISVSPNPTGSNRVEEPPSSGQTKNEDFTLRPNITKPVKNPIVPQTHPKKTSNSESSLRRERTSEIIQHLLENNDGVFPGELSLYIVMSSIWAKKYSDLKPPDRRVVQQLVNKMEKQGKLKQLHFFFLDSKGESQGICVVAKASSDNKAEELIKDPRIVSIKEKIREVHPETYIPPTFSLSQQELDVYSALLSKAKETPKRGQRVNAAANLTSTHEVEVMHYPQPVMTDVEPAGDSLLSGLVADEDHNTSPAKKPRKGTSTPAGRGPVSVGESHKSRAPRSSRKPQRQGRKYWDASKVATYIWNKSNTPIATWDQQPACLQDPVTGAWSSTPHVFTSSQKDLDELLSLIKTGKASQPKKPGRKRKNPDVVVTPRKKRRTRNAPEWKADDESVGGSDASMVGATITNAVEFPFVEPSTVESFINVTLAPDGVDSDSAKDDTAMISEDDSGDDTNIRFGDIKEINPSKEGHWPILPDEFFRSKKTSFSMCGSMPTVGWFHQANLPHNVDDILNVGVSRRGQIRTRSWTDKDYAELVRRANAIRSWELSAQGSRVLQLATVVPGSIFIDLGVGKSLMSTQPMVAQWPQENQYTVDNLPGEIVYGIHDDHDAGLSDTSDNQVQPVKPTKPTKPTKSAKPTQQVKKEKAKERKAKQRKAREFKHPHTVNSQSGEGYVTRNLIALPPSQQGRVSRRRPSNDIIRMLGDTAIITAIVVVKSLLGGVEGTIDYGLILKIFPERSFTRLKNYWPKACKQRKRFVDALTDKFQSSFLEAYEKGELPPLDLDNPEDYDWTSLIIWASKLETHGDVDLPESREELDETYLLEEPDDEVIDWREVWFSNVAVHTRIEANIAKPAVIPACAQQDQDQVTIRGRSWIRSLCTTPMGEVGAPNRVMRKLLELGNGNEQETNQLFSKIVAQLIKEKIATRGKSKKFGFRLNFNFDKVVEKSANTEKFFQAAVFKSRLDEAFRSHGEMFLSYASDDGTIMAVINLQAYGRVCMEPIDVPNVPFGFEPGNYEGRSYPKSYYHWKIRLLPTATYLYNEDMPLLDEIRRSRPPTCGPHGTIPIWVDLLNRVDHRRWVEYVCMIAFALATKGPVTPASAAVILRPVVEPFEVQLIMDFLDQLGLLQRAAASPFGSGATAGEWWWLAVGQMIDVKGKGVEISG